MNNRNAKDKSEVVAEIPAACSDEWAALAFLEKQRWGGSPVCPHCASANVYAMSDRASGNREKNGRLRCRACEKQFTVRTGTVLEDSRIPLKHWCYAFWAACSSKKGVSALQIKRMTGLSYKSALFLMHRIRWAMREENPEPLSGILEIDETFVGGKPRNRNRQARANVKAGRGTRKAPVVAIVQRGGEVRAMHMPTVNAKNLSEFVYGNAELTSRVITDEFPPYKKVIKHFDGGHDTIRHSTFEYARGDVTTNTVEGFFALLKRGVYGTFHSVSKKHLHRYVSEFEFRYNHRKMDDGARTVAAIRGAEGKRLCYRAPTAK